MRIISNFRDYYDGVQRHGQDLSCQYIRKPLKSKIKKNLFPKLGWGWRRAETTPFQVARIIGVCGKIYPQLEFLFNDGPVQIRELCFNIDGVDKLMQRRLSKKHLDQYYGVKKKRWRTDDRKVFIKWFDEIEKIKDQFINMFIENRSPIFVVDLVECVRGQFIIEWNSRLEQYEFMKVIDPFTIFQEISMFMSNLAQSQKPMPIIPNELKIETHGFDVKQSFRNPKRY